MLNRRRHHYSRRSSALMPTLVIVLISMVAALGGAIYWDKQQEEAHSEEVALLEQRVIEEEEIRLPDPEADGVVLSADDKEVPADESPSEEKNKNDEIEEQVEETVEEDEKKSESEPSEKENPMEDKEEESKEEEPTSPPAPATEGKRPAAPSSSAVVKTGDEVDASYFADAVFVGDSLTQGIQLYGIIDTTVLANRGINLQTVYKEDKIRVAEGYTGVIPELKRIQPAKIYVQLGMNDIAWRTQKDFNKLYGELIDNIKDTVPGATIYIQSIFPVTNWYSLEDNGIDNSKVVTYNQGLSELAAEKDCHYLDVHSALINDNGVLPDEASPDGIHLNGPYYQRWFTYLKTHVA